MRIYMLRHGETDWNVQRLVQGSSDVSLNENGIDMAKRNAKAMQERGMTFDAIYVSPKIRAKQTAGYVADYVGVPMQENALLSEIDFGEYEGVHVGELMKRGIYFDRMFFYETATFKPGKGGETIQDTIGRADAFLKEVLIPQEGEINDVLLVAHGEILHAMLLAMLKEPVSNLWRGKPTKNCELYVMEYKDGTYTMIEDGILLI